MHRSRGRRASDSARPGSATPCDQSGRAARTASRILERREPGEQGVVRTRSTACVDAATEWPSTLMFFPCRRKSRRKGC
jgi:hypothetical protein